MDRNKDHKVTTEWRNGQKETRWLTAQEAREWENIAHLDDDYLLITVTPTD